MRKSGMHKKITIFVTGVLSAYNFIDMLYGAVFILLMSARGLSAYEISIVFSISSLSLAIFDYPSGNISDLWGRKKIAAFGFISWGIGLILFAMANTFLLFIVAALLMSLGIASISGSPQAWYIDELKSLDMMKYKDKHLPRMRSIMTLFSALGAGVATLLVKVHLSFPLVIAGIVAIVVGVITYILFDDNYGEKTEENIIQEVISTSKRFLKDVSMRKLLVFNFLKGIPFLIFVLSWQVYAVEQMGLKEELIGTLLLIFMLVMSLAGYVSSIMVKKISNVGLSTIGLLICSIGFLGAFLFNSIEGFLISVVIYEFGLGMEGANTGAWIQDLIPSDKRATYYSGLSAIQSLFNAGIIIVVGGLVSVFGYQSIWLVACFIQVGAILFIIKYLIKRSKLTNEESLDCR